MNPKDILPVADGVSWIGSLDRELVTFDIVMETQFGTTYNSYFIDAGKKTIIDTVKKGFSEEFLARVRRLCDPAEIEYIICNHTEPDHSGSLKDLLDVAPNSTVIGSGQALNYLSEMIDRPFRSMKIKDGDTLDLGNKTLKFTVWFSATPILWYRAILIINFKIARIISVEIFLKIGLQDKIMIKRCCFSGGLDSSILKYLLEIY